MDEVSKMGILAPFSFAMFSSGQGQIHGSETRAARAKSIGEKRILPGDAHVLPQEEAGPLGTGDPPATH